VHLVDRGRGDRARRLQSGTVTGGEAGLPLAYAIGRDPLAAVAPGEHTIDELRMEELARRAIAVPVVRFARFTKARVVQDAESRRSALHIPGYVCGTHPADRSKPSIGKQRTAR